MTVKGVTVKYLTIRLLFISFVDMIRSRIAPTPSGFLHQGNACNFLLTEKLVRDAGGSLRLRIDDLDSGRVRQEYLDDIFKSLAWLGIVTDEGPGSVAEQEARYSQMHRLAGYDRVLSRLVGSGRVFACSCSRSEVARSAVGGQYAGTCRERNMPLDTPGVVWRFRTDACEAVEWGDGIAGGIRVAPHETVRDLVIRRRDGIAAYQVASLSDDLTYGINLIVRGADLIDSTAAQLLLAQVLGEESFLRTKFFHHPLMLDANGAKLSKSAGSESLKGLRDAGVDAVSFRERVGEWIASLGIS